MPQGQRAWFQHFPGSLSERPCGYAQPGLGESLILSTPLHLEGIPDSQQIGRSHGIWQSCQTGPATICDKAIRCGCPEDATAMSGEKRYRTCQAINIQPCMMNVQPGDGKAQDPQIVSFHAVHASTQQRVLDIEIMQWINIKGHAQSGHRAYESIADRQFIMYD
jgi:hypothetical protein